MVLLNPGTFLINVDVHPFPQEIFKKTSQTPNTSSALGRCSATNFKSSWNAVRKPADGWSVFLLLQTAGGALKKYIYIYTYGRYPNTGSFQKNSSKTSQQIWKGTRGLNAAMFQGRYDRPGLCRPSLPSPGPWRSTQIHLWRRAGPAVQNRWHLDSWDSIKIKVKQGNREPHSEKTA